MSVPQYTYMYLLPEIRRNHSISDDTASTQYSEINKVTECNGLGIAFGKRKSKLIMVSKMSRRLSENEKSAQRDANTARWL